MTTVIKTLWLALWGCGFFANAYFVVRWLTGDRFLPVRLANYFLPWIGLVLLICLAVAMCSKKLMLSVVLLAPLTIIGGIYAPQISRCWANSVANPDAEGVTLKVMSYNVWRDNQDMAAAASIIRREKPDILMLQEIHQDQLKKLLTALNELSAEGIVNLTHDPGNLEAIVSRFQIKEVDTSRQKNRYLKTILESPFGPVTVISIHGARSGWSIRHKGMEELLREDVLSAEVPVILGGDFNTTDQSQTYQLVKEYLANTHDEAGCGFGFTFPARSYNFRIFPFFDVSFPPFLRIDHIFHNSHFVTRKSYTLTDSGGSDHLPVVSELIFQDTKKRRERWVYPCRS